MTEYSELQEQIRSCTACPLHEKRKNVVISSGQLSSKIMMIGEGPGKEEDEQGKPFIGRAGKLLDEILTQLGYDRNYVYVANIVKCRPPSNRNPFPFEADSCLPFLHKQIEIVRPTAIVTLGIVAAINLLGFRIGTTVRTLRETPVHYFRKIPVICTYHPAAALRRMESYAHIISEDIGRAITMLSNQEDD